MDPEDTLGLGGVGFSGLALVLVFWAGCFWGGVNRSLGRLVIDLCVLGVVFWARAWSVAG